MVLGGFQNLHKVYAPKINVFYVDLGDYMQLRFLNSTMPKLKISSIIPMYIHIFSPQTLNQSCRGRQNNYVQSQQTSNLPTLDHSQPIRHITITAMAPKLLECGLLYIFSHYTNSN